MTRYRQTLLGVLWAVAQPLGYTVVFWIGFGDSSAASSGSIAYPLFTFIGSAVWLYFSKSVLGAASSVVLNAKLITQIAFPRLVIPLAIVIANGLDLLCALTVAAVLCAVTGHVPTLLGLVSVTALVLMTALLAFGLGSLFGAIHVRYRDVGYALTFAMQLWFFLSPVIYSTETMPRVMLFNPMTGILEGFRNALCGGSLNTLNSGPIFVSLFFTVASVVIGIRYFRAFERDFSDVI